jgi:hypothetical protein
VKSWRADELVLDAEEIAKITAKLAAEDARRRLEGQAAVALSDLRKLFEGYALRSRSEAEIQAIVTFRNSFCISAAENAGPG